MYVCVCVCSFWSFVVLAPACVVVALLHVCRFENWNVTCQTLPQRFLHGSHGHAGHAERWEKSTLGTT